MTDSTSPSFGMNRRDLLKRGAVVGGTLMWAAPTVQSIGMRAAFAQDAGTPLDADLISCVTIAFTDGTNCFFAKWEDATDGSGGGSWETDPGGNCPQCGEQELDLTGCEGVDGSLFFDDPEVCSPSGDNEDCLEFCLSEPLVYDITGVQTKDGTNVRCTVSSGLSDDCVRAEIDADDTV